MINFMFIYQSFQWTLLPAVVLAIIAIVAFCYIVSVSNYKRYGRRISPITPVYYCVKYIGHKYVQYRCGEYIKLDIPEKSGYIFCGWYKDKTFAQPINTNEKVVNNMILYPKWVKEE